MSASATRTPSLMRSVNDLMLENRPVDPDESMAFFCECGREGCYQAVWLTPGQYEEARRLADWTAVSDVHRDSGG